MAIERKTISAMIPIAARAGKDELSRPGASIPTILRPVVETEMRRGYEVSKDAAFLVPVVGTFG